MYFFIVRSMYSYCSATMTEVFPCFFFSCKANARVKLAKTGHGPHSSNCCVVLCIVCFVSFYVLFVCKCVLLPPGDNTIAVNKYIISLYTLLWTWHSMLPHHCMSIMTYFYRTFLTTVTLARFKYELPDDGHRPGVSLTESWERYSSG